MWFVIIIAIIVVILLIVAASNRSSSSYSSQQQRTTSSNHYSNYGTSAQPVQKPISSTLSSSHPAVMLHQLTRQCFRNDDNMMVQMATDIVHCAEEQQELSQKFKKKFDCFFIQYPDYPGRLTNHTVEFNGYTYTLGFALELIMIGNSETARKRLAATNLNFQDRFGDAHFLGLFDIDEDELEDLDADEKEDIIFNAIPKFVRQLEEKDLEFIEHVQDLLRELNTTFDKDYQFFRGYSNFDDNESQYPAMVFDINEYDLYNNFKYNFERELVAAYCSYSHDIDTKLLRIYNVIDTLYCYIEMCTRFKTHMTIIHGYYKAYTRKYETLNGSSIRNEIKEKVGDKYVEAIDKCLMTMLQTDK